MPLSLAKTPPAAPDAGRHRAGAQRAQLHQAQAQVQAAAAAQHLLRPHFIPIVPHLAQAQLHLGSRAGVGAAGRGSAGSGRGADNTLSRTAACPATAHRRSSPPRCLATARALRPSPTPPRTRRKMSVSNASSGCSSDTLQPVQRCSSSATLAPSGRRRGGASRCVSLASAGAASHSAWPQAAQQRWRRRAAAPRARSSRQQLASATAGRKGARVGRGGRAGGVDEGTMHAL